jgi:cell division protein FtsB
MDERQVVPGWKGLIAGPVLALLAAGAVLWLDGERGFGELLELQGRVASAEARVRELEREKIELRMRARGLRADPLEVETVARESLGMLRPGERVVRFATSPAPRD